MNYIESIIGEDKSKKSSPKKLRTARYTKIFSNYFTSIIFLTALNECPLSLTALIE